MTEEHYQELLRLKELSSVPSVKKVLEDMINSFNKSNQQQDIIREPIKRSKAQTQTVYITKGHAWSQNSTSVFLYIPFQNAQAIPNDCFSLNLADKGIEINISNPDKGVNYQFKISQLYDRVASENYVIKYKKDKIMVMLQKYYPNVEWVDLRKKTTQTTYNELERYEKAYEATIQDNFVTPFTTEHKTVCPKHNNNKENTS